MLELLGLHGPATATQLAARVGESSGVTSYHLRQLERYGFIEEDPDRGSGRERWWRRVPRGISITARELWDDPVTREATNVVLTEWNRSKQARTEYWRETYSAWPVVWSDASLESSTHLRLTLEEFQALTRELDEFSNRWHAVQSGRQPGTGYVDIELQANAFPVGDPPPGLADTAP